MQERVDPLSTEPEQLRIRGFKLIKRAGCLLHVTSGHAVVDAVEDRAIAVTFSPTEVRGEWVPPMDTPM
jgi:hypothetical protein